MVLLTLIVACLERTGEEVKPLDPRFTELPSGVGAEADGAGWQGPFDDYEGEVVRISGVITSEFGTAVDLDFRAPDAAAEGGRVALGKVALEEPGVWSLAVPLDFGSMVVESFQDLLNDGPTEEDPYGWIEIEIGSESLDNLEIQLEVGGLQKARLAANEASDPFADFEGTSVNLSGTFASEVEAIVQVDMRHGENLENLAKWLVPTPGPWSISVPESLGAVEIQAFQDVLSDGPSDDDPFGFTTLEVKAADLDFGSLALVEGGKLLLAEAKGHSEEAGENGSVAVAPFADHEGPWTEMVGQITSALGGSVIVDVRVSDSSQPGGNKRLAGFSLEGPGTRTFRVPQGLGELILELYQDPDSDGPSDLDPWAQVVLQAGAVEQLSFEVELISGARGQPGGSPGGGGGGSLLSVDEEGITISGEIVLSEGLEIEGFLDLDVFTLDSESPGGRRYLGKLKLPPGEFSFDVPKNLTLLEMEAFHDQAGDGPTPGDAFGTCSCNPLKLDGVDVKGLVLEVSTGP